MAFKSSSISLQVKRRNNSASQQYTTSISTPNLFFRGFCFHPTLQKYVFIAYDAPDWGISQSSNLSINDVSFLVACVKAILTHFKITIFHLIGLSMGNLAPEDCILSRQVFQFPSDDHTAFLNESGDHMWSSSGAHCVLARCRAGQSECHTADF
ncbi:alpha/beta-hydrolase [Penicillium longicatenatum]|uniref:alpha/beta-hydrolase n=1 Tax=Penicillium longicatenatum TaxID=1561947 RepID=UPI00254684D6|nr:alpha/beta-hydrolase [Penicillium longicatenatum]KAJ5650302.1 alpha/beta-hydrolase [Penicillium longicatenatum]